MKHLKLRPTVLGTIVLTLTLLLTLGTSLAQPVSRPSAHGAAQGAQPGAEVFKARCAVCHGTLASGKMGPPLNALPPEIASLPPQELTKELPA